MLRHLPFMHRVFGVFRIPRIEYCKQEFVYIDLVDASNNVGNKIVVATNDSDDFGDLSQRREMKFPLQRPIWQNIIDIVGYA